MKNKTILTAGIEALGKHIYVDPVGENVAWEDEPKADLILVTHDHYDHLDTNAVKLLSGKADGYTKMAVGTVIEPFDKIAVEAVPAYNISPEQLAFHPKERGDAGYIITIAGTRIYISGDTEDNEDVLAIKDIDTDIPTDIDALQDSLKGVTDVLVRPLQ